MAEDETRHDESKKSRWLQASMSSCLPLLVFHHETNNGHDDKMLMFSLPHKSLLIQPADSSFLPADSDDKMIWWWWSTPQGWVLMMTIPKSPSSSAWLWNPVTGDKLPLPDMVVGEEHDDDIPFPPPGGCKCVLSHKDPAAHPGCVVVLLDCAGPNMWYCPAAGNGGWRRYTYDIGDYPLPEEYLRRQRRRRTKRVIASVAAVGGKLYFVNSNQDMGAVDFSSSSHDGDPRIRYFDVALVDFPPGMCSGVLWLVESREDLFLVCVCFLAYDVDNIGAIHVYRMDMSLKPCWRRVHDIGGDVVFLLERADMAASCSLGQDKGLKVKGNQICFMKNFKDDDAHLCIFDLELDTQEIVRVHQHDDLHICRKPFWIVPPAHT